MLCLIHICMCNKAKKNNRLIIIFQLLYVYFQIKYFICQQYDSSIFNQATKNTGGKIPCVHYSITMFYLLNVALKTKYSFNAWLTTVFCALLDESQNNDYFLPKITQQLTLINFKFLESIRKHPVFWKFIAQQIGKCLMNLDITLLIGDLNTLNQVWHLFLL